LGNDVGRKLVQAKEKLVSEESPKLDRNAFRQKMREAFEQTMDQVAEAVNNARCGRWIRDSEEKARDVLEEFRRVAFETAVQMRINAAEAAFSPSEERNDSAATAAQGAPTNQPADSERPVAPTADPLAR
jgi:hypothetical protein